jgi:hypothetical protein
MTINLLRSPEYDLRDFNEVLGLLTTHSKSIKFKGHSKVDIRYKDASDVKHWNEFFEICQNYRTKKKISENDYVFLLTEYKNTEDYFGWTDELLGNYFIQTSDWNQYFSAEVNKHFPISYEVVAWILRSLMYDTQEELLANAHIRARGCVMDFCDEKEDIILKMRTGDVCNECLKRISDRGVNPVFLGNIFNTMENIRKGLMYRERNELLGMVSSIRIKLGVNRPKFVLTDVNDLIFNFDESQTAIYLFLLQAGGVRLTDLSDLKETIKDSYRLVKNGNILDKELETTVSYWVDPRNPEVFTQKVSKINKKIKDLLGEKLALPYMVINEKGKYKTNLSQRLISIEGI